jgi:hypothetical protein
VGTPTTALPRAREIVEVDALAIDDGAIYDSTQP